MLPNRTDPKNRSEPRTGFIFFGGNSSTGLTYTGYQIFITAAIKMNFDKFEEPTKRILSCENLRSIEDNHKLIDKNLPVEFQKFLSAVPQTINVKEANEFESTEATDTRVKKLNELDERFKNFRKNFRKQAKRTDYSCELHPKVPTTTLSVHLNAFLEKDLSAKDVEGVIKKDEDIIQQHASNLEIMSKFLLATEGFNVDQPDVPVATMINECTTLLREIDCDIDYLNESDAMYNGLSTETARNPYAEEINQLKDNLHIQ